jgi:hypothetical protein
MGKGMAVGEFYYSVRIATSCSDIAFSFQAASCCYPAHFISSLVGASDWIAASVNEFAKSLFIGTFPCCMTRRALMSRAQGLAQS